MELCRGKFPWNFAAKTFSGIMSRNMSVELCRGKREGAERILEVFLFYRGNLDGMFWWNFAAENFSGISPRKLSVELCRGKCPWNYAAGNYHGSVPRKVSAELCRGIPSFRDVFQGNNEQNSAEEKTEESKK